MKLISFLIAILLFTGCDDFQKSEVIKVKIVNIDPPKRFKIIVLTDEGRKSISISKRCSVKNGLIGTYTLVKRNEYYNPETRKTSYTYSQYYDKSEYCY